MNNPIVVACQDVEAVLQEGLRECRRGRFDQGCLSNTSQAGKRFAMSYKKWMDLRAVAGDIWVLSQGYGK